MPTIQDQIDSLTRSTDGEGEEAKSPQSLARTEVSQRVFGIFDRVRDERDRVQDLFRDRTLTEYINDNVKRFVQFKRRPPHKKAWQSNLASTTPNEKLIGVISKLATQGMEAKVISTKEISPVELHKEKIANGLLRAAASKNDDDFQIILEMLEALEKGTVIGFEDWKHGKCKRREVTDQDPETGELKFTEKIVKVWNDVRSSLVNLEDFYPGNIHVRPGRIQDLDDCFLRTIMTEDEFNIEFGKYIDADLVTTRSSHFGNESTPFWRQAHDVRDNEIEVLRYFNQKTDEYVILANEIWINPIGKSIVSPLPWNHKKLPFWGSVGEPLDASFFYGRPIIDKLISFSDAKDGLLDRMIDQMTLAVSPPIMAGGDIASSLTKGFFQPNNVITVDYSEGKPNAQVLSIPEPSSAAFQMYSLLHQNLEQSSVAAEVIGGASGADKTATQAQIEQEGALQVVSLFLKFMEFGIREKNRLRFPNMLQFYTLPSNKKETGERFRKVILRSEKVTDVRTGNEAEGMMQITIRPDTSVERVKDQNKAVATPTAFIEIPPRFFREFQADIEIVPQSSIKMTEAQRRILELNWQKMASELYPDLIDRQRAFRDFALAFSKDPDQVVLQQPQQQQGLPEGAPQAGNPTPGIPGVGGTSPAGGPGLQAEQLVTV